MTRGRLITGLALLAVVSSASAAQSAAPLRIRADTIQVDQRTGISTYAGRVRLVQDGMTVRAAHVTVHSTHGQILAMRAYGDPLHLVDRQPGRLPIFGRALRLYYQGNIQEVTLIGHVRFRQGADTLNGHIIHYYTVSQQLVAVARRGHRVSATLVPHAQAPHPKTPLTRTPP